MGKFSEQVWGDPRERGHRYLEAETDAYLTDLVVAETVYVLESFYEAPRDQIGDAVRALLASESVHTVDPDVLRRPSMSMNGTWRHTTMWARMCALHG